MMDIQGLKMKLLEAYELQANLQMKAVELQQVMNTNQAEIFRLRTLINQAQQEEAKAGKEMPA